MVLRMTRPTKRPESSFLTFRKRVPAAILAKAKGHSITLQFPEERDHKAFAITVKVSAEIKFSLRTADEAVAKIRNAIAEAALQRTWEAMRAGPRRLTHKQIVALSGQLYKDFTQAIESDPGPSAGWQKVIADNAAAQSGEFADGLAIFEDNYDKRLSSLEAPFGPLVDIVLQREGLLIDQQSRALLLREAGIALAVPSIHFLQTIQHARIAVLLLPLPHHLGRNLIWIADRRITAGLAPGAALAAGDDSF